MNRRLMTIFLVAAVIAGGCTWVVYRLVSARMIDVEAGVDDASDRGGEGHSAGLGVDDRRT